MQNFLSVISGETERRSSEAAIHKQQAVWDKGTVACQTRLGAQSTEVGLDGSSSVVRSEPAVFFSQPLDLLHQRLVDRIFLNQTVDLRLEHNMSHTHVTGFCV
ncbi:hypothetical protein GOODEAATRI_033551 [Goodea atripinnis]|uniref:Uncharacterized protein n=1 Tax=Goodea atripinnis TaxID=208336 RepID=A0ABV0PUI4_9TELE